MLAIKEAASDMSPYVRKTAAHAIPKLYRYSITYYLSVYKCDLWGNFNTVKPWLTSLIGSVIQNQFFMRLI